MLIASFPDSGAGPSDRLPKRDKILFDKVVLGIINSKKIVVVAGAGMSCSSGIPDFRSENGLYSLVGQMTSTPDSNTSPCASPSSTTPSNPFQTGKDLFTSTTAFSTPHSTSLYLRFIASLLLASRGASPTRTHRLLKRLEEKGRLLRVWTQNVDGLEGRAGLSGGRMGVGVEEWVGERSFAEVVVAGPSTSSSSASSSTSTSSSSTLVSRRRSLARPRQPQPTTIELHGNVHFARCNLCSEEYPTRREWVDEWVQGGGVGCEACAVRAIEREFRNARPLKSGILLPSLVLYDQPHPQGEDIILAQDKDIAKKPDCLIILGTSLKVVGIKRMVKDFIKTIREEQAVVRGKAEAQLLGVGGKGKTLTPTQAARVKKPMDRLPVIFVNKTRPDKEWEPLVDVWIEAECDAFAEGVESVWRAVRPGDWQVQKTLDGEKVGWVQVGKQGEAMGKEKEMGGPIGVPSTPRKNKGRNPLGPGGHMINHPEMITVVAPSTPKGKSNQVNPIGLAPPTPMKTPQKATASSFNRSASSRTLKRTRDEENDPFSSSGATILLPPSPERTPKRRRRHTDYGPVMGAGCGSEDLPSTPRRYKTRSKVSGFGSDDSDLSEGLA